MALAKRICSLLLRIIAFAATFSAAVVMATSHERSTLYSVYYEVRYTDIPAFKYFVISNAIVCVYSFVVIFLPWESPLWRLVVALDTVFTLLLSSSMSAALAIARVGKEGDYLAGWLPICGQLPKYCHQITGALAVGFLGLFTNVVLLFAAIFIVLNPFLLPKD